MQLKLINPLLNHSPFASVVAMAKSFLVPERLETERLLLRCFKDEDWLGLHKIYGDARAVKYTSGKPVDKFLSWRRLATLVGHWQLRGYGPYAVVEKNSGHVIGPIGLWYPPEWPEPEIKYSLAPEFWGKGYATEAGLAVKHMAGDHLKWKRLISLILTGNEASKKLAQRLGGVYEKTIPFRNSEADIFAYDLTKSA